MDYDFFMDEALNEAQKALARGDFPVGCVMVHRDRIVARGSRRGTAAGGRNELDHAEMVALRQLVHLNEELEPAGLTVFCTMEPCLMCFSALILAGVGEVVFAYEDAMGGGSGCDRSQMNPLYRDSPIVVRPHVRRSESLALFQKFFADPANRYWRGSLLAQYILDR
ncbi:MAG: nucleoside deaminase [Deltaproteobacteria bacterium]|nr:nucleoside deaminase [Deltaproteobacteria bacterium]